ncbi:MAG: prepilin-type N-terminal cleavage/methylation domain-containing protein [Aquificae bacterium]|nr:prepilin-type N-terminal cleavage/methylation domain-containing protein [Aquificota bacterium]
MKNKGFTLIELAIVLIIIGLILGMIFKGKNLIENAKVKHLATQYNKVIAAVNAFYDRYGFYPGDGCTTPTPTDISTDCSATKNGVIDTTTEYLAFWHLLINVHGFLKASDRKTVFGFPLHLIHETNRGKTATWLYFLGNENPPYPPVSVPIKYICALDQMIDDGEATTGDIVFKTTDPYSPNTDCWILDGNSDEVRLYLLP